MGGAAFRAANMSKAFRVGRAERSVGMIESTYFPIGLRLEELPESIIAEESSDTEETDTDTKAVVVDDQVVDDQEEKKPRKKWSKRVSLFSRKSELLKKKKIKLSHDRDFTVTLKYDSHTKAPMDETIGNVFREFNITGLEKFAKGDKKHLGVPQVELVFQLDANGVPIITKAEAKLEEIVIEVPKEEETEEKDVKEEDKEDKDTKEEDKTEKKKEDDDEKVEDKEEDKEED